MADAVRRAFGRSRPILKTASRWLHVARDMALPNQCALCGNLSHDILCRGCDTQYWNEARFRCPVCALPVGRGTGVAQLRAACRTCQTEPPQFDGTFTAGDYRAPLDTLALDLKFHARMSTGRAFARHLHAAFEATDGAPPDVVAPVPLSAARLRKRGYNQAWSIAKPLARLLGAPADVALIARIRDTAPQAKLDLDTRRRNVGDAFRVMRPVQGRHVALVDDVMTSGATLDALARTLKAAGACRVTNFVALRTPHD